MKDKKGIFKHAWQTMNNFYGVNQLKTHQRCGGEKFLATLGNPAIKDHQYE